MPRTNVEGWETIIEEWLKVSWDDQDDAIFVFSVDGGDAEWNVIVNLVRALDEVKKMSINDICYRRSVRRTSQKKLK
jgi:D-sedoheptulose 7-phosphate isomerase